MADTVYTDTITAGALVRRQVRALLDVLGISHTEYKGFLDSTFVIRATPDQYNRLLAYVRSEVAP